MKPLFFLIVLPFFSGNLNCQSHVNNGSFETASDCPAAPGALSLVDGWYVPPGMDVSSPDYFNACGDPSVNVPENFMGSQHAFDGVAYVGIATYSSIDNYREYTQTQLSSALLANHQYLVSFRASCAGSQASNNIGALISTSQVHGNGTWSYIGAQPQINRPGILTNTIGWTEISGTYIASGGESYLTIGNFFDDDATIVSEPDASAYYYIDDVSITLINLETNEWTRNTLNVYPNPFVDEIHIDFPPQEIDKVELYGVFSKFDAEMDVSKIRLGHLPTGIYVIALTSKNGKTLTRKIIKQ